MDGVFTTTKKGYAPEEVDKYINELKEELSAYKENEQAIARALIHAENTGQQIIDDANLETIDIRKKTENQLLELQKKIKHMRMKLDAFQSSYNQLMHKYIITMNSNDFNELYKSLDHISDSLTYESQENSKGNVISIKNDKVSSDF